MRTTLGTKDFTAPSENAFGIEHPEAYYCQVWHYNRSHSVLTVSVCEHHELKQPVHKLYLVFDIVLYYQGPMWWEGAKFSISEPAESLAWYIKLTSYKDEKADDLSKEFDFGKVSPPAHLFTLNDRGIEVKILASSVTITDDISDLGYAA